MDREMIENMLDQMPLRITMNDGRSFFLSVQEPPRFRFCHCAVPKAQP